ncbi:MAG TPA: asparagine synthase-related protein [Vicinamibacterales bacterium]|nr:asparagine synthase-related protein [Vicinamibacterales bacterium]
MSAVAGIVWRTPRPARAEDLHAPTAAASHRAGGPFTIRCAGPVALAVGDRADRSPAVSSSRILHDSASRTTVIVDGCIDNLDEMSGTLGTARDARAVALAACRRWDVAAGARLLGDFVIVFHDEAAQRVLCIRDPMGQRPLYYGSGGGAVVFASEAHQVVRHPAIRRDINEGMVAEYLSTAPATLGETLWRDVYRVPPAHALEITARGAAVQRYWDFNPEARVRHASDDEYGEEFRALFTDAVARRTVDAARVGVFLSGGVDSSAVAAVVQQLHRQRGGPALHAFSALFPGRSCDERQFIDAVVDAWRLPSTRAAVALTSAAVLEQQAERYLDFPMPPAVTADVLRRAAAACGMDVMLTGFGGDDYFSGSPRHLLELVRGCHLIRFTRALVNPWLSDRARRRLRPLFGARPAAHPWIRPELARRAHLDERLRTRAIPPFPTMEQREIYAVVRGLPQVLGDEMEDRAAHAAGVPQRHPFYDRRVAEFGLALPPVQRLQHGVHKVVIRNALRDCLPPVIAARTDKAEFSSTYVDALRAIGGGSLFAALRSEELGWVDGPVVRAMYERMIGLYSRGDGAYIRLTSPLWTVASLEFWLARVHAAVGTSSAAFRH